MINNNNSYQSVNDFSKIPMIPYKIIQYLLKNGSEEFWKLLKYQTVDALEKPNLTIKEKKDLLWDGASNEEDYTIFFKPLIGNSMDSAQQQIRLQIFRYATTPTTIINANIIYEIDIITQEKCSNVRYNGVIVERTDLIENLLLSNLNNLDIGIGQLLKFDRRLSRTCQSLMNISNSKSFYGRSMFLGINLIAPNTDGGCI